jgi:GNAT superfamily N-acetyltransferase
MWLMTQTMIVPCDFSCTETVKNGVVVTIRAMRPEDRDRIAAAVGTLNCESVYSRLFSYRDELTEAGLGRIMTLDQNRDMALLVTTGSETGEIVIGSGRYAASSAQDTAEVAFIVQEDYQGLGIAGRLLTHLAEIARKRGIVAFEADVLAGNKAMLAVFARSGLPMKKRRDGGVAHITLSLESGYG